MVHSQSESDPKLSLEYSGSPHESKIEHSKAIDGATLRAGRRQRYDGKGEVVPLYRFVSENLAQQQGATKILAFARTCYASETDVQALQLAALL